MAGRYDRKQTDTTQPEPVRTPAPASSASPSSNAASGVPLHRPHPPLLPRRPVLRQSLRTSGRVRCWPPTAATSWCTMQPLAIGGRTMAWMLPLLPG